MKYYNITQKPLKIYGLAVADAEKQQFCRLPENLLEKMPQYDYLGRRATGGRVHFCTNSSSLTIRMTLNQTKEDINIPLSGSARSAQEFAQYLAALNDMNVFVYDYDHNANDIRQLSDTHEAFFRTVRKAHPDLPVLMMSRPDTDKDMADARARKEIIYATYSNAKKQGDEKVWFLDGGTFFGSYIHSLPVTFNFSASCP